MIFVTVGTSKYKFKRIFDYIDHVNTEEDIIIQMGNNKYNFRKKLEVYDYLSIDDMDNIIKRARVVITHGGSGTIFRALQFGKKVIVIPRMKRYNELVAGDHQVEFCNYLLSKNYCLVVRSLEEFVFALKIIDEYKFNRYKSNEDNFIKNIGYEIDNLLGGNNEEG